MQHVTDSLNTYQNDVAEYTNAIDRSHFRRSQSLREFGDEW